MSLTVTLAELRTAVRWRSDTTNATNPSDAEINWYVNKAIRKLYGRISQLRGGMEHYGTSATFSISSGTDTYSFATILGTDDLLHLIGVDLQLSGVWVRIGAYNFQERNRYSSTALWSTVARPRFSVVGRSLRLHPTPESTYTGRVWYVPRLADLSLDADTFDGVNGWEEFVELDAAIQIKAKREQDVQELLLLRRDSLASVMEQARNVNEGEPVSWHDVERTEGGEPWL